MNRRTEGPTGRAPGGGAGPTTRGWDRASRHEPHDGTTRGARSGAGGREPHEEERHEERRGWSGMDEGMKDGRGWTGIIRCSALAMIIPVSSRPGAACASGLVPHSSGSGLSWSLVLVPHRTSAGGAWNRIRHRRVAGGAPPWASSTPGTGFQLFRCAAHGCPVRPWNRPSELLRHTRPLPSDTPPSPLTGSPISFARWFSYAGRAPEQDGQRMVKAGGARQGPHANQVKEQDQGRREGMKDARGWTGMKKNEGRRVWSRTNKRPGRMDEE